MERYLAINLSSEKKQDKAQEVLGNFCVEFSL